MTISKESKKAKIKSFYFTLSSFGRSIERRDVFDDEWEEILEVNNLSAEEFDRFQEWWLSSDGVNLQKRLEMRFSKSIISSAPEVFQPPIKNYLESANWPDFLSELANCEAVDSESFILYAVEQGLCWNRDSSVLEGAEIGKDEFNNLLEKWFLTSFRKIEEEFVDSYSEFADILEI